MNDLSNIQRTTNSFSCYVKKIDIFTFSYSSYLAHFCQIFELSSNK